MSLALAARPWSLIIETFEARRGLHMYIRAYTNINYSKIHSSINLRLRNKTLMFSDINDKDLKYSETSENGY